MALLSARYEPRHPADGVLHQIVLQHFETFRAQAASLRDGEGLPRFVEQEFRDFLRCGWLAGGFARFRCTACGLDRLVAFSCKGRGFCPSAVAVLQRFGGALNLNVHVHALVLDGVFAKDRGGGLTFHAVPGLTALDVAEVLATVEPRLARLLERRGLGDRDDSADGVDAWAEDAPDERAVPVLGRCHARSNGFDLHAGLVVPAGQRDRLERVCRYALRPPVATERLRMTRDGQVCLHLRQRWADGTTQLVFDPVEFLGRLAVLVPRPRINLVLYHGVLGARAAWRAAVVPRDTVQRSQARTEALSGHAAQGETNAVTPSGAERGARGRLWADLMRRAFGFDVLACPRCGGRLRLVALIDQASVIQQILGHRPAHRDPRLDARPCPAALRRRPSWRRSRLLTTSSRAARPEVRPSSASPTRPGPFPPASSPPALPIRAVPPAFEHNVRCRKEDVCRKGGRRPGGVARVAEPAFRQRGEGPNVSLSAILITKFP